MRVRTVPPVHLLPVVELLPLPETEHATELRVQEMLRGLGLTVLSGGGVLSRLHSALRDEARALVSEGRASEAQINRVLRRSLAPRLTLSGLGEPPPEEARLVGLLRAAQARDADAAARLSAPALPAEEEVPAPLLTRERAVPLSWADYNGHMNEARYLEAFGEASDAFMAMIGCDADYLARGSSFFTVETHIRHLDEVRAGAVIRIETWCLAGRGKRLHLYQQMYEGGRLLATGEQMFVHVDLTSRRASAPAPQVAERLERIAAAHARHPRPEGAGRYIGQPRDRQG
jgi:carnitine 3-dehydrogenase